MSRKKTFRSMSALIMCTVLAGGSVLATESSAKPPAKVNKAAWAPGPIPPIYDPTAGPKAQRRTDHQSAPCTSDEQLDCVESIGAFLNGAWVNGTVTDTMDGPSRVWRITGLVNPDGTDKVTVSHFINYTGNIFLTTLIAALPPGGGQDVTGVQRDVKFRATIRTSWVLPTHISTKMLQSQAKVEKLSTSGASRITVEGVPTVYPIVQDQSTLTDPAGKAFTDNREYSMTVSDGRFYPIKKACIELPTLVTSDNGYGHLIPKLEGSQFNITIPAPHFRSDGVTEHVGHYSATIPMETAECLWDLTAFKNADVTATVVGSKEETANATASASITDDGIVLKADGFLFSSPTVRLEVKVPKPKKPTRVRITTARRALTVTLPVVANQTYKVTATKKATKTLSCKTSGTKTTCTAKSLSAGQWRIKVVARNIGGASPAWSTSVRIR